MKIFFEFLNASLISLLIQNCVFSSGYAFGETIRLARRPKYFLTYVYTVFYYTFTLSLICSLIDKIEIVKGTGFISHCIIYTAALGIIHVISCVFMIMVFKVNRKFLNSFGMCALNSLVLAVPLLNYKSDFSVAGSLGAAIGAAAAFVLAVMLINSAMKKIMVNNEIPKAFRGLPAVFIYTALLSLCFACFN